MDKTTRAFLDEYPELFKAFKVIYEKKQEQIWKDINILVAQQTMRIKNLNAVYKLEYQILPENYTQYFIEPFMFTDYNSSLIQFKVIDQLFTFISLHNHTPITFHESNNINPTTDTSCWTYNPTLFHNHFIKLLEQIQANNVLRSDYSFIYNIDLQPIYINELIEYKQRQFEEWAINHYTSACLNMNKMYYAIKKIKKQWHSSRYDPSYKLCKQILTAEFNDLKQTAFFQK